MNTLFIRFFLTVFAMLGLHDLMATTVPEPSTIIYGKVFHRAFGHEQRITEGTLTWTFRDQNGRDFQYQTELENIRDTFSYRLAIPHQALASGLSTDASVIPLRAGETRYDFVSISINGVEVEVLSAGAEFIKILQSSRAATHRIDLRAMHEMDDSDGDGMPDWWEKLHGLDWQIADAHLDPNGDGWTNLQAYRNGGNPLQDHRVPSLLTKEIAAYASSDNGVWLRAIDANSTPSQLTYTIVQVPNGGTMIFDSGSGTLTTLYAGARFTQKDLDDGKVLFSQSDELITSSTLSVSLSDGTNAAQQFDVQVKVFSPGDPLPDTQQAPSWWRQENRIFEAYWSMRENMLSSDFIESSLLYFLGSNHGWTLWDQRQQTLPLQISTISSGSHFLLGGDANDTLRGSAQDDIIDGGLGSNRLHGGSGRDLFIVNKSGLEIIEDFAQSHDLLDLSGMLHGKTGNLNAFLSAQAITGGTEIRVNQSGTGNAFSDASIRLEGVTLVQDDLHRLWANGQLLLGAVTGFSSISVEGWPTTALEEAFDSASLTFRRRGPTDQPLTVALQISGSATNGTDYTQLPPSITFPAGQSTTSLLIEPLIDGLTEGTEILQLAIAAGSGYVAMSNAPNSISISDAKQRFNIAADDQIAIANGQPAYFVVTRSAANNSQVQIRLTISGAVSSVDYAPISTLVTFGPNETHRYLEVQALALGDLARPETSKLLSISLQPSSSNLYLLGNATSASIRLLSDEQTFEQWASQNQITPSTTTGTNTTPITVSPRTGLDALLEYAFSYGVNLNDGVSPNEQESIRPKLTRDAEGWHFEFSKRLNDPTLDYIVERSSDLVNWHSDPAYFSPMTLSTSERNRGRVRYRVINPPQGEMPYMRVRVQRRN